MRVLACVVVLASAAHAGPAPIAPEELRHELFYHVVIAEAERDWGIGPITIEHAPSEHDSRLAMARAIDPKHVPAALRAWRGRKLNAGLATPPCIMEVTGLRVLAVTEPGREDGFWDDVVDPLPARGVVLSTWNRSHAWLAGELSGDCIGRTWARAADLKAPSMAEGSVVSGPLRDQALAAFRALPAYRTVKTHLRGAGEWDTLDGVTLPVLRFDLPGRTLLSHVAYIHDGQLTEQLLVIWELRDGAPPELKLRQVATTAALPHVSFGLDSAFDLRGDGRVLFTYMADDERGALYETGAKLVDVPSLHLATP
jgi:hypothetical protein